MKKKLATSIIAATFLGSTFLYGASVHQIKPTKSIRWIENGEKNLFNLSGGEIVVDEESGNIHLSLDLVHKQGRINKRNTLNIVRKIGSSLFSRKLTISESVRLAFNYSEEASMLTVGIVETGFNVPNTNGLIRINIEK